MDSMDNIYKSVKMLEQSIDTISLSLSELSQNCSAIAMNICNKSSGNNDTEINANSYMLSLIEELQTDNKGELFYECINKLEDAINSLYVEPIDAGNDITTPISSKISEIKSTLDTFSINIETSKNTLEDISSKLSTIDNDIQTIAILDLLNIMLPGSTNNSSTSSTQGDTDATDKLFSTVNETMNGFGLVAIGSAFTVTSGGTSLLLAGVAAILISTVGGLINDLNNDNAATNSSNNNFDQMYDYLKVLLDRNASEDERNKSYDDLVDMLFSNTANTTESNKDNNVDLQGDYYGDFSYDYYLHTPEDMTKSSPSNNTDQNNYVTGVAGVSIYSNDIIAEVMSKMNTSSDILDNDYDIPPWIKENFRDLLEEKGVLDKLQPGAPYANYTLPSYSELKGIFMPSPNDDIQTSSSGDISMNPEDVSQLHGSANSENVRIVNNTLNPYITVKFGDVYQTTDINELVPTINNMLKNEIKLAPWGDYNG